jgi:hypothetical protein
MKLPCYRQQITHNKITNNTPRSCNIAWGAMHLSDQYFCAQKPDTSCSQRTKCSPQEIDTNYKLEETSQ